MSSDFSILCLFVHFHSNSVTIRNFESIKKSGCKVIPIKDMESPSIENSHSIETFDIIRGDVSWSNDILALNYALQNKIHESHILLCNEYTYCDTNINELLSEYKENDVTTPEIMLKEKDGDWQHFKNVKNDLPLLGLLPCIVLIKTESFIKIAEYCKLHQHEFINTNDECRLGTISNILNFKIKEFDQGISRNIKWHETTFIGRNLIYHPVKTIEPNIIDDDYFDCGIYEFYSGGAMGDQLATISNILYDHDRLSNVKDVIYINNWDSRVNDRANELLKLFKTTKKIQFVEKDFHQHIKRQPVCPVQNHQFPYYKSNFIWEYKDDLQYDVCFQFDTSINSTKYLPSKVISKEMKEEILKAFEKLGFKVKELGIPNTLQEDIRIILNSKLFVGIDSGMSHICHTIGIPIFIKEFDKNILKTESWHYLDFFHGNKYFSGFYDLDELIRKIKSYRNLKPFQKQEWKNYGLFRLGWSDRFCIKYNDQAAHFINHPIERMKSRKVFIDGGCFHGDSIRNFLSMKHGDNQIFPKTDAEEYEIIGFDGVEYSEWYDINHKNICFKVKLLGNENRIVKFHHSKYHDGNSIFNYNDSTNSLKVANLEMIDLSKFIIDNFNITDYIILKLDVEGAEYAILEKMIKDRSIEYINELYVEFHDFAKENDNHDNVLIDKLKQFNIIFKRWY